MRKYVSLAACLVVGLAAGTARLVRAQQSAAPPPTWVPDIRFASGREVVPYLEGWIKNPDESFDFVFGYFNRNTEQELVIPAGTDNAVMPGGPDRGQPTYFMPRRQPRIFRVRVPKDWGTRALTWTITANGHTEKVVAQLIRAYEKDERFIQTNNNTGIAFGEEDLNKPPTIAVAPLAPASVNAPITLTAAVTDDGLPKLRGAVVPPLPAPDTPENRFRSQRNSTSQAPRLVGPRVTWQVYRGTGTVTIEHAPIPVSDGKAVTSARFSAPGSYMLIATAGDGRLNTATTVVIDVK